jgi:hypothetical protein
MILGEKAIFVTPSDSFFRLAVIAKNMDGFPYTSAKLELEDLPEACLLALLSIGISIYIIVPLNLF